MAQQTATDWLFKQLWETPIDKLTWYAILEQSKQIEKQQIIDAFDKGTIDDNLIGNEYYKETYNK